MDSKFSASPAATGLQALISECALSELDLVPYFLELKVTQK